ncbi:hypothetical protein SAY87_005570 [Trapa incisa]|uniref:MAT1 centre domain-containing protein n=2 Tax=Trapa TaxID=22665 RepID=A0AAN7K6P2_9MYRT|nr:hypothetical protein SAY87_005570 [Trapa incisa]
MVVSSTNPFNKEISIRRRISSIFNKREEDFPSLREYNDYLEEVEEMTINYVEGVDVPLIEAKISKYQEENSEQIMINRARKAEELAAALAASKGQPVHNDIDGGTNQVTQDLNAGPQGQYAPTMAGGLPRPMGMGPQPMPLGPLPDMHAYDDKEMMKIRAERGSRAGGWTIEFTKKRALEEAFGSLWL